MLRLPSSNATHRSPTPHRLPQACSPPTTLTILPRFYPSPNSASAFIQPSSTASSTSPANASLFQTTRTYQSVHNLPAQPANLPPELAAVPYTFTLLHEHSLDPRQLAPALHAAVRATTIRILNHTALRTVSSRANSLHLETTTSTLETAQLVHTQGAWSLPPVTPRKGQMLSVRIPPSLHLDYVIRTPEVYIVPRTAGLRAGDAVIGATVEDAGFDTQTDPASIARLRALATLLLPALADAPTTDQWGGLRPHTPNHLPLLGQLTPNQFLATGHYRNGILLAPATAWVLAQLLAAGTPILDLTPFSRHISQPAIE